MNNILKNIFNKESKDDKVEENITSSFSFKHGNVDNIYNSKEIEKIRHKIAYLFKQEVEQGAIDEETNKPFKCNESKVSAIYDRLKGEFQDGYSHYDEFIEIFSNWTRNPKKFWSKCAKISYNIYYIMDLSYIIKLLSAPKPIIDILSEENDIIQGWKKYKAK